MDFELERELKERIKELEAERAALQQRVVELEAKLIDRAEAIGESWAKQDIASEEAHYTLAAQLATAEERITELEAECVSRAELLNVKHRECNTLRAQLAAAPGAARWEYVTAKVVIPEYVCTHYLSHEGWELVCAYPDGQMIVSYWKRQRPARQEVEEDNRPWFADES